MINFNVPPFVGKEQQYIKEAIENNQKNEIKYQFLRKRFKDKI